MRKGGKVLEENSGELLMVGEKGQVSRGAGEGLKALDEGGG